jgi:hypothetical protein
VTTATRLSCAAQAAVDRCDWDAVELKTCVRALLDSDQWHTDGVAILEGLPVEEAAAYPVVEAVSSALGTLMPQDGAGVMLRSVRYRNMSLGQGDSGRYSDSRDGGNLHTDGPHRPGAPPTMFVLMCVRQSTSGGALVLVETAKIVRQLDPRVIDVLSGPFAFDQREQGTLPVHRAVLHRDGDRWLLAYLRAYIELGHQHPDVPDLTDEQRSALDDLDLVIDRLTADPHGHTESKLKPGQLIVVDNRRLLHGRTSFGDREDDRDRLMLRTWIATDADATSATAS